MEADLRRGGGMSSFEMMRQSVREDYDRLNGLIELVGQFEGESLKRRALRQYDEEIWQIALKYKHLMKCDNAMCGTVGKMTRKMAISGAKKDAEYQCQAKQVGKSNHSLKNHIYSVLEVTIRFLREALCNSELLQSLQETRPTSRPRRPEFQSSQNQSMTSATTLPTATNFSTATNFTSATTLPTATTLPSATNFTTATTLPPAHPQRIQHGQSNRTVVEMNLSQHSQNSRRDAATILALDTQDQNRGISDTDKEDSPMNTSASSSSDNDTVTQKVVHSQSSMYRFRQDPPSPINNAMVVRTSQHRDMASQVMERINMLESNVFQLQRALQHSLETQNMIFREQHESICQLQAAVKQYAQGRLTMETFSGKDNNTRGTISMNEQATSPRPMTFAQAVKSRQPRQQRQVLGLDDNGIVIPGSPPKKTPLNTPNHRRDQELVVVMTHARGPYSWIRDILAKAGIDTKFTANFGYCDTLKMECTVDKNYVPFFCSRVEKIQGWKVISIGTTSDWANEQHAVNTAHRLNKYLERESIPLLAQKFFKARRAAILEHFPNIKNILQMDNVDDEPMDTIAAAFKRAMAPQQADPTPNTPETASEEQEQATQQNVMDNQEDSQQVSWHGKENQNNPTQTQRMEMEHNRKRSNSQVDPESETSTHSSPPPTQAPRRRWFDEDGEMDFTKPPIFPSSTSSTRTRIESICDDLPPSIEY